MGKRTYAQLPNGKILPWIELLGKYNLVHNEGASAHTEWDGYILNNKKLPNVKVVTKNDDGEFEKEESDDEIEEVIEDNNEEVNCPFVDAKSQISNGKKRRTYAQLPNGTVLSWIELLNKYDLDHTEGASAHTEWDSYILYNKKLPNVRVVIKKDDVVFKEESDDKIEEVIEDNNEEVKLPFVDAKSQTFNGKKRRTHAQLPDGTILSWIELLNKYDLDHNDGASAHTEWDSYVKFRKGLPNVKVVYSDDSKVDPDKKTRKPKTQSERFIIWDRYFPGVTKGLCPCCEEIEISLPWYIIGHNKPFSKGGTEDIENLVPICGRCNDHMKNTFTIEEYKEKYFPKNGFKKLLR